MGRTQVAKAASPVQLAVYYASLIFFSPFASSFLFGKLICYYGGNRLRCHPGEQGQVEGKRAGPRSVHGEGGGGSLQNGNLRFPRQGWGAGREGLLGERRPDGSPCRGAGNWKGMQ